MEKITITIANGENIVSMTDIGAHAIMAFEAEGEGMHLNLHGEFSPAMLCAMLHSLKDAFGETTYNLASMIVNTVKMDKEDK